MSIGKIFLCLCVLTFIGCADSTNTSSNAPVNSTAATPGEIIVDPSAPATPPTAEPAQNADGVWHYTCPTGCAGGGGSATACATCGTTLAHNQGYHASAANTNAVTTPGGNPTIGAPQVPKAAEPAQNAAGVWHYTCANGCAGGGASAGPCGGCGSTLAHNAAYHQ